MTTVVFLCLLVPWLATVSGNSLDQNTQLILGRVPARHRAGNYLESRKTKVNPSKLTIKVNTNPS